MFAQNTNKSINPLEVLGILTDGLKISLTKECRLYLIIPICINLIVLAGGAALLFNYLTAWIDELTGGLPTVISGIISFFLVISLIIACCFLFSTVATIIASPFYGLLAERVEMLLTGRTPTDDGWAELIKSIPRSLAREVHKQIFFLPRALLCLIILLIPGVNVAFPILWFLLTAWMGCLQYVDYAYDNNKVGFKQMRFEIARAKLASFLFGAVITFLLSIPIVNILVPPSAVCAGTKYYLRLSQSVSLTKEAL